MPPLRIIIRTLQPVPHKLVMKIQAGEFVDMAELLPDQLGSSTSIPTSQSEEDKPPTKPKRKQVTNILEWVQCFNIYIAVISTKSPSHVKDLLGYQTLIIQASMEYRGDGWLGYKCMIGDSARMRLQTLSRQAYRGGIIHLINPSASNGIIITAQSASTLP